MRLEATDINYRYNIKKPWILRDVSLTVESGERVGIVAPSGYGKSTLGKILAGYEKAVSGSITIDGEAIKKGVFNPVQMISQHPEISVNPRWKMKKILTESYNPTSDFLKRFGIKEEWMNRWPTELSGGELQRFCIARVLSDETKFLVCDEITTMLDPINQAEIWKLLIDIVAERDLGMIIITHNKALADRVCTKTIYLPDINHIEKQED